MSFQKTSSTENIPIANMQNLNNHGIPDGESKKEDPVFECYICLETAKDAVVNMCGHLFCWPCLYKWLAMKPGRQICPVCNSIIGSETVVPIYGRNCTSQDPKSTIPPRPPGHRVICGNGAFENLENTVDFDSESSSSTSLENELLNLARGFDFVTTFEMPSDRLSFDRLGLLTPSPNVLESSISSLLEGDVEEFENTSHVTQDE